MAGHRAAQFLARPVEGRVELKTWMCSSGEESRHEIIYGGWSLLARCGIHKQGINCPLWIANRQPREPCLPVVIALSNGPCVYNYVAVLLSVCVFNVRYIFLYHSLPTLGLKFLSPWNTKDLQLWLSSRPSILSGRCAGGFSVIGSFPSICIGLFSSLLSPIWKVFIPLDKSWQWYCKFEHNEFIECDFQVKHPRCVLYDQCSFIQ